MKKMSSMSKSQLKMSIGSLLAATMFALSTYFLEQIMNLGNPPEYVRMINHEYAPKFMIVSGMLTLAFFGLAIQQAYQCFKWRKLKY